MDLDMSHTTDPSVPQGYKPCKTCQKEINKMPLLSYIILSKALEGTDKTKTLEIELCFLLYLHNVPSIFAHPFLKVSAQS